MIGIRARWKCPLSPQTLETRHKTRRISGAALPQQREMPAMQITVEIGVQQPERVDTERLRGIFPYGQISFSVVKGGLDVPRPAGNPTVIANAAISVALDVEAAP